MRRVATRQAGRNGASLNVSLARENVVTSLKGCAKRDYPSDDGSTKMGQPDEAAQILSSGTGSLTSDELVGEFLPTVATTPSQSPDRGCRNSRAVGYHGLSSRSSIQRQSGTKGSNIHTGLPSAPARCATAVSTLMTRSSCVMTAAVSAKSANCLARWTMPRGASCFSSSGVSPGLSVTTDSPGELQHRRQTIERNRALPIPQQFRIAGPDDPDLARRRAAG